jgi:Regulator of chromosome condensation (RCC1) repeat
MKTHRNVNQHTKPFVHLVLVAVLLLLAACQQTPTPQATPEVEAELSTQALTPGTVVGWGRNGEGQLDIPAGLNNVIAIAAGEYHSLALKRDGTVVGWGWNIFGQINIPAGLSNVTAIAAGGYHGLALESDGTVVGWGGENDYGQTTSPPGLSNVTAIAAGALHSLALTSDTTGPSVTLNQATEQADPTTADSITFILTVSEPVYSISAGLAQGILPLAVQQEPRR